jgi:hypothetical protein
MFFTRLERTTTILNASQKFSALQGLLLEVRPLENYDLSLLQAVGSRIGLTYFEIRTIFQYPSSLNRPIQDKNWYVNTLVDMYFDPKGYYTHLDFPMYKTLINIANSIDSNVLVIDKRISNHLKEYKKIRMNENPIMYNSLNLVSL